MADTPNTFMLLLRLGLSLAVVFALVGAVTWALRRRGLLRTGSAGVPQDRLEVVDRRSLGKRASVVVARIGDVQVLLGVTDQQVNVLAQAPQPGGTWVAPTTPGALAATSEGAPASALVAAPTHPTEEVIDLADSSAHVAPHPTTVSLDGEDPGRSTTRSLADHLHRAAGAARTPRVGELIMGSRRTGTQVDAAASTTPTGMSFVEALRELTVRKS